MASLIRRILSAIGGRSERPAPKRAARMIAAYGNETLAFSGYANHAGGTSNPPTDGWVVSSLSPREDIDKAQRVVRQKSRDLYMSSSFYGSILHAKRDGVIGRGLELDAKIDADALGLDHETAAKYERRIEAAFARFSRKAGADGESLNEILSLAYFSTILSGDCLAEIFCNVEKKALKVRLLEGDCVLTPESEAANPKVQCGVELNANGSPVAYHVMYGYAADVDGLGRLNVRSRRLRRFMAGFLSMEGEWIPPREHAAILIHTPFERPGQMRGLPIAARVLTDMKQLDRYMKAELDAAVVASKPALFRKHPVIESVAMADSFSDEVDTEAHECPPPIDWGNGLMVDLYDGAEMQAFNPMRPNSAYANFVDHKFAEISANLGMSAEVALKRWNASYSASRASLLDAQKSFEIDRARFVDQFLRPVYNAWLDLHADELGLFGYYENPEMRSAWRCAEWIGEQLPNIDPTKEIDAAAKRVALGVSTLAREAQVATGADIYANIRQRGFEERLMREHGLVKDQNGVPVGADNDGDGSDTV